MAESGWKCLFDSLAGLTDENLAQNHLYPRRAALGDAGDQPAASPHCIYHVGQIVLLAKHFAGEKWNTLTIPRGRSADFNARVAKGEVSQR